MNMNTGQKIDRHLRLFPGIWIVLSVMVFLTARIVWCRPHSPHHIQQLAKDFSSIDAFRDPPVVNHAGTLIGMVHNTPQGMGVFIANIPAKTEQTICEAKEADVVGDPHVFGWSSDDSTFAYRWNINLHFVNTNAVECPGAIPTPYLKSFTWLSPDSCAYIDSSTNADSDTQLAIAKQINGRWQETASWPLTATNGTPRSLLAMGSNAVVWYAGNSIWRMDLSTGEIKPLYSTPPKCAISSLSYSKDTGQFLFIETTNRARTVSLFAFSNGSKVLKRTGKTLISDAQWINKGKGYAYLIPAGDNASLFIQAGDGQVKRTFFSDGQIAGIFCDGESPNVYALASYTNEAPSIWLCNTASGDAQCLLSPWGFAAFPVCFQPALVDYAPMPDKHEERFVLIPPANFSRHKKYPLVIGMQGYDWMNVAHATYSQAIANRGAFVALTGYHFTRETPEALIAYTNNVLAVYNQLAKNPNVDTNRVYLFAFSLSTIVVNHLIDDYPRRWRGVMLFGPTAGLPTPKAGRFPPILVTAGSDEEWLWKQFPAYQEKLAQAGISMEWFVHSDEGHIERSQNTMYQRTLLMGKMIFGD